MEELPSSELGTKKHWDKTYNSELVEFKANGDVGEVWFGEDSEERILDWLTEEWLPLVEPRIPYEEEEDLCENAKCKLNKRHEGLEVEKLDNICDKKDPLLKEGAAQGRVNAVETPILEGNLKTHNAKAATTSVVSESDNTVAVQQLDTGKSCSDVKVDEAELPPLAEEMERTSILDLGTGNGHFLLQLAQLGFTELCGVDYSESGVSLARAVAEQAGLNITYEQVDLTLPSLPLHPALGRYSVCHDKGTYDAISLTPGTAGRDRLLYLDNVCRLLDRDGVFVITSCNWTEDELLQQFDRHFTKVHTIPSPTFCFGGKTGSLVTTLVLKKLDGVDKV